MAESEETTENVEEVTSTEATADAPASEEKPAAPHGHPQGAQRRCSRRQGEVAERPADP